MSEINQSAARFTLDQTGIEPNKILNTLKLLVLEECTIPFISRYRKEVTGNLDEVAIRDIQQNYNLFLEIEKKQASVIENIRKQEKLTPELEKKILATFNLNQLEDIYAPFKLTKKTKAMIAKEFGLEPLSILLETTKLSLADLEKSFDQTIIANSGGKIKNFTDALAGAQDIITEKIAHNLEIKDQLRKRYWSEALMVSQVKDDAKAHEDYLKYKDFFEYSEPLLSLKEKKASHRFLAIRRGMSEKILKIEVTFDEATAKAMIQHHIFPNMAHLSQKEILAKCIDRAYKNALHPSLDLEIKSDLKEVADEAAISIFGVNLKNLLLQPYLGSKAVLGIDPGQRTGCKIVVIDQNGKLIGDHVIYPHPPQSQVKDSAVIIEKICEQFQILHIAVGNGTAGNDTIEFLTEHVPCVKSGKVKASLISESGASIYSASDIAREEFPNKDVTVRGAISIARRFQDPLAELVKIDPKSIGVGQYQHDVNQVKLKNNLESVVESCVNYVGVDLNTASAPLLSYISGIGPTVAKNIVSHRDKSGPFKNRQELLKVARFSDKIFVQSAGFLRIYQGNNPFDATFIHPEKYPLLETWAQKKKITIEDLVHSPEIQAQFANDNELKKSLGEHTFDDVYKSLTAPRQDPRKEFKNVEFNKSVKTLNDLKIGQWYNGVVTNITMFGAFVDIGIKENGLLHVSEISNQFVENASEKLQVGQEVKVKVLSVDTDRKRISLSCKQDSTGAMTMSSGAPSSRPKTQPKGPAQPEFKNNPFGKLQGMKLK